MYTHTHTHIYVINIIMYMVQHECLLTYLVFVVLVRVGESQT